MISGEYSRAPEVKSDSSVDKVFTSSLPTGIRPYMFKQLIGKDHKEFSGGKQQDAGEYLGYLLEKIESHEKSSPGDLTTTTDM